MSEFSTPLIVIGFVAGFLIIFAVNMLMADFFNVRRQRVRKRLEEEFRLQQRERARGSLEHKELYELAAEGFGELKTRTTLRERLEMLALQSGANVGPARLIGMSLAGVVLTAGVVFALVGLWLPAIVVAPIGGVVPLLYVAFLRRRRLDKLQAQLPDSFELMSRVLRAGQTTSQALQAVADEFPAPAAEEFGYCYEQQNLGLSPEAAMRELSRRTGLLELKIFVLAMMIHRQTGGNLSDLLDKLATIIRDRYRIRGMIKALTAEGRLQGALLLALPPLLLVAILFINRPYAMVLFQYPMLLGGMFTFMAFGAVWMHRIVNFDF